MTAYSFKYLTGNEKMPFSRFPVPFFPFFLFSLVTLSLGFESTGYAPREYIFSTNEFFSPWHRDPGILNESLPRRHCSGTFRPGCEKKMSVLRFSLPPLSVSLSPFFSFCSRVRHLYTVKFKKDYIPRDSAASPS